MSCLRFTTCPRVLSGARRMPLKPIRVSLCSSYSHPLQQPRSRWSLLSVAATSRDDIGDQSDKDSSKQNYNEKDEIDEVSGSAGGFGEDKSKEQQDDSVVGDTTPASSEAPSADSKEEAEEVPADVIENDFDIDDLLSEESRKIDAQGDVILRDIGLKYSSEPVLPQAEEKPFDEYPEPPRREITFSSLLEKAGFGEDVVAQYSEFGDIKITGIQTDSRRIEKGNLYICVEGGHADGHHFIPDAINNGASLIIARLAVPGAELALYTDADPSDPEFADQYQSDPYYQMLDNDTLTMEACAEEIVAEAEKVGEMLKKGQLTEDDARTLVQATGMRNISSALNYDFSHWHDPNCRSEQDKELTPHPWNPLIPVEITTPVTFAIDPADFATPLAYAFYDRPAERMVTVGITGTTGKTVVAWLMRGLFEQQGKLTGMIGSVEYTLATDRLDIEGNLWQPAEEDTTLKRECSAPFWAAPYKGKYSVPCTTPDNVGIQQVLAGMADRGAQAAVVEASSIGLEQGRVDMVDFTVAIFTNLGNDHLDYHEDEEEYKNCKAHLFTMLRDAQRQRAVINIDDKAAETMAKAARQVPVVTYSYEDINADVYTVGALFSIWETCMTIQTPLGVMEVVTPLIGRANVYNILATVAAGISINVDLRDIAKALETAEVVPGRYEIIDEGQDFVAMVDYAHTPETLLHLLECVRECKDCKRIILVFGCPGGRDYEKRPLMGEIAHYKADVVILTNDSPGLEPPEEIIDDITNGYPPDIRDKFRHDISYDYMVDVGRVPPVLEGDLLDRQGSVKRHVIEDRFCAIRAAIAIAQKNDVVIIAGKGHEDYIEYADVNGGVFKGWFDDRVEVRNALCKLEYLNRIPYLVRKELPMKSTMHPEEPISL